jgi:hypothetical protein
MTSARECQGELKDFPCNLHLNKLIESYHTLEEHLLSTSTNVSGQKAHNFGRWRIRRLGEVYHRMRPYDKIAHGSHGSARYILDLLCTLLGLSPKHEMNEGQVPHRLGLRMCRSAWARR